MQLKITPDFVSYSTTEGLPKGFVNGFNIRTSSFFGAILEWLETHFGSDICENAVCQNILDAATEGTEPLSFYGLPEYGNTLLIVSDFIDDFVNSKGQIVFSIQDIDIFRNDNNAKLSYSTSNNESMIYHHITSVLEIMMCILHYYAYYGYKLIKCKHCLKWFATKNFKTEYCQRTSPCFNVIVCGKPLLRTNIQCEQAVRYITQKFRARKESIYQNWYVNYPEKLDDFLNAYSSLMNLINNSPTLDNIRITQEFLYGDDKPKQERPNRRSNSEKRRLMKK